MKSKLKQVIFSISFAIIIVTSIGLAYFHYQNWQITKTTIFLFLLAVIGLSTFFYKLFSGSKTK